MSANRQPISDLRFRRVEQSIKSAFVHLLSSSGFEKITVSDIVSLAKIGRGTFYLHYKNKEELLLSFEDKIITDISTIIHSEKQTGISGVESITKQIFTYFEENYGLIRTLFDAHGDAAFQTKIKDMIWYDAFYDLYLSTIYPMRRKIPEEYIASYIESANQGILLAWLRKEQRESPKEITAIILNLTFPSLVHMRQKNSEY